MNVEAIYKIDNNFIIKKDDQPNIIENYLCFNESDKEKEKKLASNDEDDVKIHRMEHTCCNKEVRLSVIEDFEFSDFEETYKKSKSNKSEDSFVSTESDRDEKVFNKYITNICNMRKINFVYIVYIN